MKTITENKIWGTNECIFKTNGMDIYRLVIWSNRCCSKHVHRFKSNLFRVEYGVLQLQVWDKNNEMHIITLTKGKQHIIKPGVYHRFLTKEDQAAIIYEISFLDIDIVKDIEREESGGIRSEILSTQS